ncbi:MAG: hypothetical protein OXE02_09065 [Chloroflexi bacterium]|nr:hypothetical protein [Chloroflexota bacterium]
MRAEWLTVDEAGAPLGLTYEQVAEFVDRVELEATNSPWLPNTGASGTLKRQHRRPRLSGGRRRGGAARA